ncbi:MAG: PKD domain-containing protein [Desulfatibacillaceae bacterium]
MPRKSRAWLTAGIALALLLCTTAAFALPGDLNGSGRVDGYDLITFGRANGSVLGDPAYNPDADMNGDNVVDSTDLSILSAHFGRTGVAWGLWMGQLYGSPKLMKLSSSGSVLRQTTGFSNPKEIAGNPASGDVWVTDLDQSRIVLLDSFTGAVKVTVHGIQAWSIAANPGDGSVWAADYFNNAAVKIMAGVPDGYDVSTDTGFHQTVTGLSSPQCVDVDPVSGVVWIGNTGANQVVRLSPTVPDGYDIGTDSGKHLTITGASNTDVAVDTRDGSLWVVNSGDSRIRKYSATGNTRIFEFDLSGGTRYVKVNPVDGSAWISTDNSDEIMRMESDGTIVFRKTGFNEPGPVGIDPLTGNAWVPDYTNKRLVLLSSGGVELKAVSTSGNPLVVSLIPDEVTASRYPATIAGVSPRQVNPGDIVNFAGAGNDPDGQIVRYEWDFDGDGVFDYSDTASGDTTHSYTQVGVYAPVFRVTDDDWLTATDYSHVVRVGTLQAIANASVLTGTAPLTVGFTPDFVDPVDGFVQSYQWDFDGDNIFDVIRDTLQTTSHTYSRAGTYMATLMISDPPHNATDSVEITVYPATPVITANVSPTMGFPPMDVSFTASATDADGAVSIYQWDFDGDGAYDWNGTANGNVTHTYSNVGDYTATVKVTDDEGMHATRSFPVSVGQAPPVAVADADVTRGYAPLTVNFEADGSYDTGGSIVRYEWNFEGETTPANFYFDDMESGTGGWTTDGTWALATEDSNSPTHAWTDSPGGNYDNGANNSLVLAAQDLSEARDAILTFQHRYDMESGYDQCHVEISVNDGAWQLLASYSGTVSAWTETELGLGAWLPASNVRIRFRLTSDSSVTRDGWYIDDVSIDTDTLTWTTSADGTGQHTYDTAGLHTATLRVTDDSGATDTDQVQINVLPPDLPTATASADVLTGTVPLTVNFTGSGTDPDGGIVEYSWDFGGAQVWFADRDQDAVIRLDQDGATEITRFSTGFSDPCQVAVSPFDGSVWVTDYTSDRLQRFGPDGEAQFFSPLAYPVVDGPAGLAVSPLDGSAWVTDSNGDRLVQVGPNGAVFRSPGSLDSPWDVAVDPVDGSVWAAARYGNVVVHMAPDGTELARVTGFDLPLSVALDSARSVVWVTDSYNDRLVRLDTNALDGYDINTDTGSHTSLGGFDNPHGVALNPNDGTVWVADHYHDDVVHVTADASSEITRVTGFSDPIGIAVNPVLEDVWVADYYHDQVVHLDPDGVVLSRADYSRVEHIFVDDDASNYVTSGSTGNASFTYDTPGIYHARLTVRDADGNTDSVMIPIVVRASPAVSISADAQSGPAPLEVFFQALATDADSGIGIFAWDFDGDGYTDLETGNGAGIRHVYDTHGFYTASVTVSDNHRYTATDSITINVQPVAPEVTASATPARGLAPLVVEFSAQASDRDGSVVLYEWDFDGDGSYDDTRADATPFTHTYNTAGTYMARVRVTDNDSLTGVADTAITVDATGTPLAMIQVDPVRGATPLDVSLYLAGTDPEGALTNFDVDFEGDDEYDSFNTSPPTAFGDNAESPDAGWTVSGTWVRTTEQNHSGSWCWTESPGGDYADGVDSDLVSPTIDLSAATSPVLMFRHRLNTLSGDYCRVYASGDDGGTWTQLTYYYGDVPDWTEQVLDLSNYAGNPTVKIRFMFDADAANVADGWYIDDVWVGDPLVHTYTEPGMYTPTLRVTDGDSMTDTAYGLVSVYAVDTASFVWVADTYNHQVKKLSNEGELLVTTTGYSYPRSVAADPATGDVWVADPGKDRVLRLYEDLTDGYDTSPIQVEDFGPNSLTGTVVNEVSLADGNIGGAYRFNGYSDYVRIDHSPELLVTRLTMEAWVKTEILTGNRTIMGKVSQDKDFSILLSEGKPAALVYSGGRQFLVADNAITTGTWHHIAMTYDTTTDALKLYLDGSLSKEMTVDADISNTDPLCIGMSWCCSSENTQGSIDDARYWNVARTEAQIDAAKDATLNGDEPGLVGYWKLDDFYNTHHTVRLGFPDPYEIEVDPLDNGAWIVDRDRSRVTKLSRNGTELARVTGLFYPEAISLDHANRRLWIVDRSHDRVIGIPADVTGAYVAGGTHATADSGPNNITVYTEGDAIGGSGYINGGVYLDGSGDFLRIPWDAAMDNQTFTIEMWIKPEATGDDMFFMRGDYWGANEVLFGFNSGSQLDTYINGVSNTYDGGANLMDGNWHHVAMTYDGATVTVYVDGSQYGTASRAYELDFGESDAIIGADMDGFNRSLNEWYHGGIDEVRLWSTARTGAEIATNMFSELAGTEDGLVGYWKLDSFTAQNNVIVGGITDPVKVVADPADGGAWMADQSADRVFKVDASGGIVHDLRGYYDPWALALNKNDRTVWACDYWNHQVAKISPNGLEINRTSRFNQPFDVDVNLADSSVWVADYYNHQIVKLAPDGTELVRVGGFNYPRGVSVDWPGEPQMQPPTVSATASPEDGDAPLTVAFDATATDNGSVTYYEWDFDGDGTYDYTSAVTGDTSHDYGSPGTYNPVLRVTDDDGLITHSASLTIHVGPLSVRAWAFPDTGTAPFKAELHGVVHGLEPDSRIVSWEWDFDGDGTYDHSNAFTPKTSHTFSPTGMYYPVLRVTDDQGRTAVSSAVVNATLNPPVANNYASPTSATAPATVFLNGNGTDPDGSIVLYEWDYDGDGLFDWFSETTADTYYTYSEPGTYTTNIRVTDNDGLSDMAHKIVTIGDAQLPPTVDASADTLRGAAPLLVNFTAAANDPDDGQITLYEWDFDNDGVWDSTSTDSNTATHTYSVTGIFTARVRVTDADGLTAQDTLQLDVKPPGEPTAVAGATPTSGPTPLDVSFTAAGSGDDDGFITSYEWSFGGLVAWVMDYTQQRVLRYTDNKLDQNIRNVNNPYYTVAEPGTDNIWFTDFNNDQVVKLDGDTGAELVRASGFDGPAGIDVHKADNSVWVANRYHDQVVHLSPTGTELLRLSGFNDPMSVAVDQRDGSIWVADYYNDQLKKFDSAGNQTGLLTGFDNPRWVAVDHNNGAIWVADEILDRVVRFDADIPYDTNTHFRGFMGEAVTGATLDVWGDCDSTTGKFGNAITMDGSGDYVSLPADPSLDVTDAFTVELWIKPNSATGDPAMFMRGDGGGNNELYFGLDSASSIDAIINNSSHDFDGSADFLDGQWHHIALTWDGTQALCYVDGAPYGDTWDITATLDFGGCNAVIGGDLDSFNGNPDNFFIGQMDDLRLWNAARTAQEISDNMNTALVGNESGLSAYWDFDDLAIKVNRLTGLNGPVHVEIDPRDGSAWACVWNDAAVVKISPDGKREVARLTGIVNPHAAAVHPYDGSIWVAAHGPNEIWVADTDGNFIRKLVNFYNPTDVALLVQPDSRFSSTTSGDTSFTYPRTGEFIATLTVEDNDGNRDSDSVVIQAGDFPVSAPIIYPTRGEAPLTAHVASFGHGNGATIEQYLWDFGDGSTWSSRTSKATTHTFNAPGTYNVTQTVVDGRGLSDTATVPVTVLPPEQGAPEVRAMARPDEGNDPLTVELSAAARDLDGFIRQYEWDFDNDGVIDETSTTSSETSHTYSGIGIHTARVVATDDQDLTGEDTVMVQVKAEDAPTATGSADPSSGDATLSVSFSATVASRAPIAIYEWDFDGDGVYDYSGNTGNASHSYTDAGRYEAVLRVTDSFGRTDIDVVPVTVTAGLTASLSRDVFNPTIGESVSINTRLTAPATVTMEILDRNGGHVRTLVSDASRDSGFYSDPWDGRNDSGQHVDSGVFLYVIEYVVGGKRHVLDVTNDVSLDVYTPSVTYPTSFNPFNAEDNYLTYNLSHKAEVSIYISIFYNGTSYNRVRTLLNRKPQKAGSYVQVWDGTDDAGNLVPSATFMIAPQAWNLPENAIIVRTEPVVSDFSVSPGYLNPDASPYDEKSRAAMTFILTEAADVSATVFGPDNSLVRTVTANGMQAGTPQTVYWDGKNNQGEYVAPGIYRVTVVATDSDGTESDPANALMVIFY